MDKNGMDDFLQNIDDVQTQINKIMQGDFNEKEYNELERRVNKQKYEQLEKQSKEEQRKKEEKLKELQKIQGKSGKGQGDDYKNFCEYCQLEFEIESPDCFRCKRKTITQSQRKQFLQQKVHEYKDKKNQREERKKRWELWQKTKAIYSKKNITDYEKWNLFTDSENSDEEFQKKNPILPKDDPAFKMMENNIKKRNDERNQKVQLAERLKQQGNIKFQKKNYLDAVNIYTQGLESDKQNKALWLNRALCYIKLKRYDDAIKDCSEMIEYMDVLEDGFEKSQGFAIKAFLRRSMANFEKQQYEQALEDAKKAQQIFGKEDKEIDQHIQKIEQFYKANQQIKNIGNLSQIQIYLKDNILSKELNNIDWNQIQDKIQQDKNFESCLLLNDEYFQYIKQKLKVNLIQQMYQNDNILKQNVLHFLNQLAQNNDMTQDVMIRTGLIYSLIKITIQLTDKQLLNDICTSFALEQILDIVLLTSQQQKGRNYLLDRYQFLIDLNKRLLDTYQDNNKVLFLLDKCLKISGNLMYEEQSNKLIIGFKQEFNFTLKNKILQVLFYLLQQKKQNSALIISSIFNMFTNLLNNQQIRLEFINDVQFLLDKQKYFVTFFNQIEGNSDVLENFTNFFINLSYQNQKFSQLISNELKELFCQKLIHCHKSNQQQVCQKILLILSKSDLQKKELMIVNSYIKKNFFKQYIQQCLHNHCVLLLNQQFNKLSQEYNQKFFKDFDRYFRDLYQFIDTQKDNNKQMACLNNTIVFLSNLIEHVQDLNQSCDMFIQPLIYILKEKTGVIRKQAAIMIAKMSKNEQNLQKIREKHGTEILLNLQKYLINQQLLFNKQQFQ